MSVVLALPFEQTQKLVAGLPEADRVNLPVFDKFVHAPITTIHVWFDRTVTEMDHAALLDTRIQWMFNKSQIRRDEPEAKGETGQYLELVISASFAELEMGREEILTSALKELAGFFPKVKDATVVKAGILKEARATFSVVPGLDRFRPEAKTAVAGMFLAGDWTRTGWPSTMEGAVRSGRLAAAAVAEAAGNRVGFLTPDAAPTGFMRLLSR